MVLCISKLDKLFECVNTITMLVVKLLADGHRMEQTKQSGHSIELGDQALGWGICLR